MACCDDDASRERAHYLLAHSRFPSARLGRARFMSREWRSMSEHRQRRILLSLALSAFILCMTSRYTGYLLVGIGRLVILLVFTGLLLFVVHHAPSLYQSAIARFGQLAWLCTLLSLVCAIRRQDRTKPFASKVPFLPSRFQRPPPISS